MYIIYYYVGTGNSLRNHVFFVGIKRLDKGRARKQRHEGAKEGGRGRGRKEGTRHAGICCGPGSRGIVAGAGSCNVFLVFGYGKQATKLTNSHQRYQQ